MDTSGYTSDQCDVSMSTTWDDPTVPMNGTMQKQMLNHIYRLLTDVDITFFYPEDEIRVERCIELVGYLIDEGNRGRYVK